MSDLAARARVTTALGETLFVQAGAGTGKTTALVGRIVALVGSGAATLPEIAAITFTKAAAAELRERVRRALLAEGLAAGVAIDRAAIETLHGFAQRLLTAYPVEAGLPPGFEVADEVTSQLEFDGRWGPLVRRLLADPALDGPLRDGYALGLRLDHLRELTRVLDRDYDRLEDPAVLPEAGPPPEPVGALADAIAEAGTWRGLCTDPRDKLAAHLTRLAELSGRLREAADDRERLRLLDRARSLRCSLGQRGNWNGQVGAVRDALAVLEDRRLGLLRATQAHLFAPLLARLRRATLDAAARRAAEGQLEFHDLLVLARRLLRDHPGVRDRLSQRYRYVLIDEFQDTDPLQVEIAARLVGDEPGRLFFVGDAQQSIYRFRRADLATYEQVRARCSDGAVALTRNHRSLPAILTWANAMFAGLLGDGHLALEPHRTGATTVELIGGPVEARAAEIRDQESAAVAAAIAGLHGRWRYDDIAILLPTRTALPQLERALEDAGIPFRIEAQSLLYATQEARELLAVLRAAADPTDQIAIVAALRSPALGCTDRDLLTWKVAGGRWDYRRPPAVPNHPVATGLAQLAAFHARHDDPPSVVVGAVIRELRLLELACAHPRPREAWQRLRVVHDQARAFTERGATLAEFCAWIRHLADEDTRVTEQVLPDDDDEAVRILTVHGAKGLEFPVAILAGLASPRRPPSRPVAVFGEGLPMEVRIKQGFQTERFRDRHEAERRLDALEDLRLLYVAATRARDQLIVGVHHHPRRSSLARQVWEQAQQHPDLWRPLAPRPVAVAEPVARPAAQLALALPDERWLGARARWAAERDALVAARTTVPATADADGWRGIPVLAEVDGQIVEGVVDRVWEEAGGLVADGDALSCRALAAVLGRPVRPASLVVKSGGHIWPPDFTTSDGP